MAEMLDEVEIIDVLQDIHLFSEMDYKHIAKIYKAGQLEKVETDEVICEANTTDERLVVLLRGKMRLESAEGDIIDDIEPVRVIGEMGVFTGQERSTRVVADEECVVMFLGNEVWEEIFSSDPDVGIRMQSGLIKDLYHRIHEMNDEMRALREKDA